MSDQNEPQNPQETREKEYTWTQEIEVAAENLVDRVKELLEEGNIRRLIIRREDNSVLLEVPLTPAVAAGGVLTLFAPALAAIGAIVAFVSHVKLEVVRVEDDKKLGND